MNRKKSTPDGMSGYMTVSEVNIPDSESTQSGR